MAYSIWRNGEHLGEIAMLFPRNPSNIIGGIFIPKPMFADIRPLMQTVLDVLPHKPTMHHDILAESDEERLSASDEKCAPTPMLPMCEEAARGIPAERCFVLHDESGAPVATTSITFWSFDVPDGQGEMPDACRELGQQGSGWTASATLDEPVITNS